MAEKEKEKEKENKNKIKVNNNVEDLLEKGKRDHEIEQAGLIPVVTIPQESFTKDEASDVIKRYCEKYDITPIQEQRSVGLLSRSERRCIVLHTFAKTEATLSQSLFR